MLLKFVSAEPNVSFFKPQGVPLRELEIVELAVEEFEAVRLKDGEGLEQTQVAEKMGISQPTLHRLLVSARRKIAEALSKGKAIAIKGGNYSLAARGFAARRGRLRNRFRGRFR
jgi:predicted DNA-binding protein (UPF0251 family)